MLSMIVVHHVEESLEVLAVFAVVRRKRLLVPIIAPEWRYNFICKG